MYKLTVFKVYNGKFVSSWVSSNVITAGVQLSSVLESFVDVTMTCLPDV